MSVSRSSLARGLTVEAAFEVLAKAKTLVTAGKDVIELEIGDSPFPTTAAAKQAGLDAIRNDRSHYCPSAGLPEVRAGIAEFFRQELEIPIGAENVVVGPGAKIFQQLFCEAFLDPGDGVLIFSPYFATYLPNILRRQGRVRFSALTQEREFRPNLDDVARFLAEDPRPRAIFLNSPHNPTGGVATAADLRGLADLIRGRDVAVFSDEPYQHMVWRGRHESILAQPGMFEQCVAAYTFSKSYSMSGWRLGYAVSSPQTAHLFGQLINTALSCVPPLAQLAGLAALQHDRAERDEVMQRFREKVELLVTGLNHIPGVHCLDPAGTFYVFPNVAKICHELGISSHGLAMYLLEGADDRQGVACLGGECFGEAGGGFLRMSCAESNPRLEQAVEFLAQAIARKDRVQAFLREQPDYALRALYPEPKSTQS